MKLLIVGETCQDIFIRGYSDRQCPDTPSPVFVAQTQTENWGMAFNVMLNVKSILAYKYKKDNDEVTLVTNQKTRENITKTRFIIERSNTTICRVDVGDKNYCHISQHYDDWQNSIKWKEYDGILISDYDKGFLLEEDIEYISQQNKNTFLDTKKIVNGWSDHVRFLKINNIEYNKTKDKIPEQVQKRTITTLGDRGALYDGKIFPVKKILIKDTSGCGDTFFGSFVVKLLKTNDVEKAIKFANKCATIVASKCGVAVPFDEEKYQ